MLTKVSLLSETHKRFSKCFGVFFPCLLVFPESAAEAFCLFVFLKSHEGLIEIAYNIQLGNTA